MIKSLLSMKRNALSGGKSRNKIIYTRTDFLKSPPRGERRTQCHMWEKNVSPLATSGSVLKSKCTWLSYRLMMVCCVRLGCNPPQWKIPKNHHPHSFSSRSHPWYTFSDLSLRSPSIFFGTNCIDRFLVSTLINNMNAILLI